MQLRTFIAKDMREAMGQIRHEMGPDAVIVASQRAKGGGVMVRAAFDAPPADVPEEAELVTAEPAPVEAIADFAQSYHDGLIRRLRELYCAGIADAGQSEQIAGRMGDVLEARLRHQVTEIEVRGGGTVGTA